MKAVLDKFFILFKLALNKGFFHLLSANLLIQIAGFGGQIFLTRILSVEEIGKIKILQTYLGLALIIASVGINTAVLKLCSQKISEQEKKAIFSTGVKINIFTSFFLVILTVILAHFQLLSGSKEVNNLLKIYLLQIPALTLSGLSVNYLQSQKKVQEISYIQSISKIIIILVSTGIAYTFGFISYIQSLIVTNILTLFLLFPLLKNELKELLVTKINYKITASLLKIGSFAFGANLLGNMLLNFNIILVSILTSNSREVGYYGIANLIITTLMMIPSTLNQIMIPYISEVSGDYEKVKNILKKFRVRSIFLISIVSVVSASLVPILLPIVFGEEYSNSVVYFQILLVGMFFWSLYSPKGITLMSVGRTDLNFYTSLLSFVINLILNYVLIKKYGMIGAATANTLTYFCTIFINGYFFKVHFKKIDSESI
ncbi:oligosaccharide flippase family protein [Priestia aryabhattai]|uniref:oligosaccharide flippase family protein n=1 Tax=Priestia aryabhattai TaxID=412384 RepID=UPI001CBAFC56|nr:oligosaccharide flippase family protein [Priestia aryabhattai]